MKKIKKQKMFLLGLFILFLLFLYGCDAGNNNSGTTTLYALGDTGPSGVGKVFYITDSGLHGLEAAPSDQSTSQVWIAGGSTPTTSNGNTFTAIGKGLINSNAIIAQSGHTGSAAQVCRNYIGGGLSDWFLPSKDELNQLYLQKDSVGGFEAKGYYWSSSESGDSSARSQYFFDGVQASNMNKGGNSDCVRAVRSF